MLIRETVWEKIRVQFSEEEKQQLRANVVGNAICPKGCIIDVDRLSIELSAKLMAALAKEECSHA